MAPFLIPIISMLADKGMDAVSKLVSGGADKALEVISEKTGIDLAKAESLTPEQEKALREYDLQLKMLDFDREKMFMADVADARDMQKEALKQDDAFSKRFVYFFAAAWSIFAMLYIGCITFINIPPENVRFADSLMSFLMGTVIATVINFFFGSSKGSREKTELMMKGRSNA